MADGRDQTTGRSDGRRRSRSRGTSRRGFLRDVGAAGLGIGLMGTSGAAATGEIQVIDYDEEGFGFSGIGGSGTFEADGSFPVVEELFVFIHGWLGAPSAREQTRTMRVGVERAGYTPDSTVAIKWPSVNPYYSGAERDTEGVGAKTAALIEAFAAAGGGNVRLTGHSLGGRSVYWTAAKLAADCELATVGAMGTAAYGRTVCPDGNWYDGITRTGGQVRNYHSRRDSTVESAYDSGGTPLGTVGAPCAGAPNYADVDVTASVPNHQAYIGDDRVCADLAATFLDEG